MIGIIGGSGAYAIPNFLLDRERLQSTIYGTPSSKLSFGTLNGVEVVFLPRHGKNHQLPPHKINYRANIQALYACNVSSIISLNAVGSINNQLSPPDICIPDQIIDYTYGRDHTFYDGHNGMVNHIDFTQPYSEAIRNTLIQSGQNVNITTSNQGIYAATQGPRLETAAEINRLENDGADIVGMTGMPEAALARELNIPYASICIVVNPAAGKSEKLISMDDIFLHLQKGVVNAFNIITEALPTLATLQSAKH